MTQRNEIINLLLDELDIYGLTGEVSERGKHLEVAWETPNGRRFVIAPKTASDWRAGMNCRSDLRKLLKKDGLEPKREEATSFVKAMSLPKEPFISKAVRESVIQKDVEFLAELVMEMHNELTSIKEMLGSMQVTSTVTFGKKEEKPNFTEDEQLLAAWVKLEPPRVRPGGGWYPRSGSQQEMVLNLVPFTFTPRASIIEESGLKPAHTNTVLQKLKSEGLIESGLRGMYRRKPID